ncbi:LysM peptidoglycan-binding domain-containing protein [Xanthomonas oryzae]|uniref:LysM peptidoglycan-binding domain-containing protein n=1 Tax=Xanthomonas oryzae TaxID=347 RepID=UPI001F5E95CC|nr:LysM domain-containing protein [Xanthomonas oryzae]
MDVVWGFFRGDYVAAGRFDGKTDVLGQMNAYASTDVGTYKVTVQAGDTLRGLAQRLYGNSNLWYVLADANAIDDDSGLVAGATLNVPDIKANTNDATTFKPFNASEAVGSTTPSLPYIPKPPESGCGTLGMIIMVVVAIVVTIYTAGVAAGAMGAMTATGATAASAGTFAAGVGTLAGTYGATAAVVGGAAGAFAGSLASQGVGSAMGQTSFSWRDVAASTVAGAATAGFGTLVSGAPAVVAAVGTAAVGNLSSYVANKLVGNEASFSWKSVAASAVTAGITQQLAPTISNALGIDAGSYARDIVSGITGGVVSAHVRQGMVGGAVNYQDLFVDAFGNALSSALGRLPGTADTAEEGRDRYRYALASTDGGGSSGMVARLGDDGVVTMDTVQVRPSAEQLSEATVASRIAAMGVVENSGITRRSPPPSWSNGYGVAGPAPAWRMTGVQNSSLQRPRVQRFANDPSANLIGAGLVAAAGAATAVYDGVTEPFKMVADIGRVGWETGVSLTTGQMPEDIEYYSGFGKAIVDQDMGTLDALWSIPKGIALTPWRLGTAIYQGDAFGIGYETVSLIGALEGARTLGAGRVNVPGLGAIDRGAAYVRDLSDAAGAAYRLDASDLGVLEPSQGGISSVIGAGSGITGVPINGATRNVPLGFSPSEQFIAAAQQLQDALVQSGVTDATVGVRGSSVTGSSSIKGTQFGPQSDIDFYVESHQLTDGYSTSKNIPGFVHPRKILPDYPLLQDWSTKWTGILGRDVTPGAFVPGTLPVVPSIVVKPVPFRENF